MRLASLRLDLKHLSLFLALLGVLLSTDTVFAAAITPASPKDVSRAFRWPLPTVTDVGSSFGEYRYDHLHAGIDISTGGTTGLRVLAAAAGEVFRLKVEWRGYGRALYLRHPGGRVTVYGHLERYEDKVLGLERLVARRQTAGGTRYPGDIYLDSPIRVARGQLIAYSGESGVGLPHLHFEVRDATDRPIDPFEAGLPRPIDRRPPVLDSLIVTAASARTFVDGDQRQAIYRLRPDADGAAGTDRPVKVSGPFLAILSAYDPGDGGGRAGLKSIEVRVDGVLRYHMALHSFRFDQYPESGLLFDHRFTRLGPATFGYRLFRLPGNEFGEDSKDSSQGADDTTPGALDLTPGLHRLEIVAADAASNRSSARVCLQVGDGGALDGLEWEGPPRQTIGVRFHPLPNESKGAALGGQGSTSECASPPPGVEASEWDAPKQEFRTMTCKPGEGRCALSRTVDRTQPCVARLREIVNGVPGPWQLLSGEPLEPSVPEKVPEQLQAWPAFLDVLVSDVAFPAPPMRLAAGPGRATLQALTYRGGTSYGAAVPYARAAGRAPFAIVAAEPPVPLVNLSLDVRWVEPGQALDYPGPGFSLHLPEKARFYAGPLMVRTEPTPGSDRLPSMADAVELLPEGEALNDRATLSFDLSPGAIPPESLGIYRWDATRKRWSYEGGELRGDGTALDVRFRRYGRFALLQDASPPEILEVRPGPGSRMTKHRPSFTARVEDEGKGFNFDGVTFEVDGKKLESEFDPDRGLARALDPPLLSPGKHRLRVFATDLAGNTSSVVEREFQILAR